MTYVFSDEIEALLNGGPPVIDWDAITEQLKADFLSATPGASSGHNYDDEVVPPVSRYAKELPDLVEIVREEPTRRSLSFCGRWACLDARDKFFELTVDRPVVQSVGDSVRELKDLGAPWITFSSESVKELNMLGIDCAMTMMRAQSATFDGAVLYRGKTDSVDHVDLWSSQVVRNCRGTVSYVTAHPGDTTYLAGAIRHMFSNGGHVCGYANRGGDCGLCGGTGVIAGELFGSASGRIYPPYCVCSVGDWKSTRDDEQVELNEGGFVMGHYDGGHTPSDSWSLDESDYRRGEQDEPPGVVTGPGASAVDSWSGNGTGWVDHPGPDDIVGGTDSRRSVGPGLLVDGVSGSVSRQASDDGYCYLLMARTECLQGLAGLLGSWPTVSALLLAPCKYFDLEKMRGLGLTAGRGGFGLPVPRSLHVVPLSSACGERAFLVEALCRAGKSGGVDYGVHSLAFGLDIERFEYEVFPGASLADKVGGERVVGAHEVDGFVVVEPEVGELRNDFEEGRCVLQTVRFEHLSEAREWFGKWPTVKEVVQAPARFFDVKRLEEYVCLGVSVGKYHVVALASSGGYGANLHDVLVASSWSDGVYLPEASLGLFIRGDVNSNAAGSGIAANARLGGDDSGDRERVVPVGSGSSKGKVFCTDCECMVKPDGHGKRCTPVVLKKQDKFDELAWVGDALHAYDVRRAMALTMPSVEKSVRHKKYTALVAAESVARYYLDMDDKPEEVKMSQGVMPSDHTISTLFERNYRGGVREKYLRDTFGLTAAALEGPGSGTEPSEWVGTVAGTVYAVVMPPGHGKSHNHGRGKLVEADVLCSPKSLPDLVRLKGEARSDAGCWPAYVKAWSKELAGGAKPGDIVMVPDLDVAEMAGFVVLGTLLLCREQWIRNLEGRTAREVAHCELAYMSVLARPVPKFMCATNGELCRTLDLLCLARV